MIISTNDRKNPIVNQCYSIGKCSFMLKTDNNDYHMIKFKQSQNISRLLFSSKFKLSINYDDKYERILFSSIFNNELINTTKISIKNCYKTNQYMKRNIKQNDRPGNCSIK